MKKISLLFVVLCAMVSGVMAQGDVNLNDPKYASWGADEAERKQNINISSFMREAVTSKDYDKAATYFNHLITHCPKGALSIYQNGRIIFKKRIENAKTPREKSILFDSLMLVYNLRLEHFGNHPKQGRPFVLDSKARDFLLYNKKDRDGLRACLNEAIEANGEAADPVLVLNFFQAVCTDYASDYVMAADVVREFKRLESYFVNDEDKHNQFNRMFISSEAATCDDIEAIFKARLEVAPNDEKLLGQAVRFMDRASCITPFYAQVAETYYKVSPSSRAAMALATIFQNDKDYVKASKYLRDALAVETDIEEQEILNARIGLVELVADNVPAAYAAAVKSLKTEDGTISDNGTALFIIAQCYGISAASLEGIQGQIAYLAAYDAMTSALKNFSEDEDMYVKPAKTLQAQFKAYFPTKEECFFNEIDVNSKVTVEAGMAKGKTTVVRTRD